MEPGETEEQAIVREIREELNVEIGLEKKVCTMEYDYPAFHLTCIASGATSIVGCSN